MNVKKRLRPEFGDYIKALPLDFSIRDRWGDMYELQWRSAVVPEQEDNKTRDSLISIETDFKKLDEHWLRFRTYSIFF